jgi:hypothetical protein
MNGFLTDRFAVALSTEMVDVCVAYPHFAVASRLHALAKFHLIAVVR